MSIRPLARPLALAALSLALTAPLRAFDSAQTWRRAMKAVKAQPQQPVKNQLAVPAKKSGHTVPLKEIGWDQIESLRLLGHANQPLKLMMVLDSSTRDEVQAVFEVIRELHREQEAAGRPRSERIKMHLVINRSADVRRLEISPEDYADIVEVNEWFSTSDIWMQDWGEVAAATIAGEEKARTLVFDSRRGRSARPSPTPPKTRGLKGISEVLARLWNSRLVRGPSNPGGKGNYGGNIEVTPDDTLMIGNTATPKLRGLFADAGYRDRMVVVETDWLVVGHIDEYLSTLPAPETDLGYVLVRADPGAALASLAAMSDAEAEADLEGLVHAAFRQVRRFPEVLGASYQVEDLFDDLAAMHAALSGRGSEETRARGRGLIEVNRRAEAIIARNVETMRAALAARHGREVPVKTLSFPGLFRSSGGRSVALLPGVANMVVLEDRLLIPDPLLPSMRETIRSQVEPLGYKPKFLSDLTYHFMHGQLHCGTNVFRHPNRYVHPRYERARKAGELRAAPGAE